MALISLLILLISSVCFAQNINDNKVLAKIGNKEITVEEFKIRYELSPQISRSQSKDSLKKKEDFLHSLIAEKLWALEAENLNFDSMDVMQFTFPALEKMYIRDALYTREIKQKATTTPEENQKYLEYANYNLLTRFISSSDKSKIENIYMFLSEGTSFDSVFIAFDHNDKNALEIKLDDLNVQLEEYLYSLKPNQFSPPLQWDNKWYIFHIDGIKQNTISTESEIRNRDALVRRVAEQRAIGKTYSNYFNNFFRGKKIDSDGNLFWSFSNKIIDIFQKQANKAKLNGEELNSLKLMPGDLEELKRLFGEDSLSLPFIVLSNGSISFNEFLHDFVLEGFYTSTLNKDVIRSQLQSRVKYFIERELLAQEAINQGLTNDPEVKKFIGIWRDNYLGNLYKKKILSEVEVSNNEVQEYFNSRNESTIFPAMVNIVEILSDSLEIIEEVLRQLDKGKTLRDLAPKYTKRKWAQRKGGEFGFFPVTAYGEIGRLAGEMKVGELIGPIETADGYSIFELIEKKEVSQENELSFNDIKDELKTQLRVKKLRNRFVDKTAELASNYNVTIDSNLLESVKVSDLSMFVYRYFGFGGRLTAIPVTNPFIEWVEKWKQNIKDLP